MLTCKSVSNALERGDYHTLPPIRQKMLKLHVKLCTMCGPYNGFVVSMQDTAHEFCEHEEDAGPTAAATASQLPPDLIDTIRLAAKEVETD